MKNIYIHTETIGDEILKAIVANKNKRAEEYNRKKDLKYYNYCLTTGDKILIESAKRKLTQ